MTRAHGSTGAGNDQVRFNVAFAVLLPGIEVITPIRDLKLTRDAEYQYLKSRGVDIDPSLRQYSINSGLWGSTIGGGVTHDPWAEIPEQIYEQAAGGRSTNAPREIVLGFERGLPVSLDGESLAGAELAESSRRHVPRAPCGPRSAHRRHRARDQGWHRVRGRRRHGRHPRPPGDREDHDDGLAALLEGSPRGVLRRNPAHEGMAFEPALRDIEALIDSSQTRVSGDARVRLGTRRFQVTGVRSPNSLALSISASTAECPSCGRAMTSRATARWPRYPPGSTAWSATAL